MDSLINLKNHPVVDQHGPKIALAISILCLLIFIISCGLGIRAHAKTKSENYAPQPIEAVSQRNNRPRYRINDVTSANLFGNPAPKKVVQNAPKTTLNLKLQGILSATDKTVARAIITSGKKKKAELYSVGESIEGAGASVKEIREHEVLLNRNGATESLPLEKRSSKGDTSVYTPIEQAANSIKNPNADSQSATPQTTTPSQPRKIRKPNFSGLDQVKSELN